MNKQELAKKIEQTNLNPGLNRKSIDTLIGLAKEYNFRSICITPGWVRYAKSKLVGTNILVVSVPNWEVGGGVAKLNLRDYVFNDADEIDYIWDIYRFAGAKDWANTAKELEMVRKGTPGKLKIIIETTAIRSLINKPVQAPGQVSYETMIQEACKIVEASGADYIKTDSGLFTRKDGLPQLVEDVTYMRKYCKLPIKASAGIRTTEEALKLLDLGVALIGTSKGEDIVANYVESK